MKTFIFRWTNAIGFVKANNIQDAITIGKYRWDRPYHKSNEEGYAVWYSMTSESVITEE